ncbi:MAG TPA: pyridoxal phosphate-dependent aminotransferase [Salinivirgaceae bacterium]|nr:pyridoxal phosphate-dependent aminotransferase [Salinivirgaceae bacterium]
MSRENYTLPEGSLIGFMSNKVKQFGGINLAQGIPGFDPPAELLEILRQITPDNFHQYAPGIGNLSLRQQILEQYSLVIDGIQEENLLITNGATEALALIFHFISNLHPEQFTAMAFSPVYESYRNLPIFFGKKFVEYEVNNLDNIDFEELRKFIRQKRVKAIFVASPGNPLGYMFSQEQVDHLLEICNMEQCFLILDIVYRQLYFNQPNHIRFQYFPRYLFLVDSFSKLLSITGWRIGFFFANTEHMKALRNIHDYTGLCAPSILQEALNRYLKNFTFGESYVQGIRKIMAENYRNVVQMLDGLGFQSVPAHGGFFVWTKLPPDIDDGFLFALKLYQKTQVAVVPGIHFSTHGKSFVRFNIARKPDELLIAMERIERFMREERNSF